MVETGESEYAVALKVHKFLKKRVAQNAQNAQNTEIGPNWNVSGTWIFRFLRLFAGEDEGGLSLPAPRSRVACCRQIMLVKRLPDQGLDYRLAADV